MRKFQSNCVIIFAANGKRETKKSQREADISPLHYLLILFELSKDDTSYEKQYLDFSAGHLLTMVSNCVLNIRWYGHFGNCFEKSITFGLDISGLPARLETCLI